MWFMRPVVIAALLAVLGAFAIAPAIAQEEEQWTVVETVDIFSHTPRIWVNLLEQGSIDYLGFEAHGGEVRCYSLEFWFADGRRQYVNPRLYNDGEVERFRIQGTNRAIHRIALNCRPIMGVTRLQMSIMVR